MALPGFQMMLWGCQRTCFVSVHCAYENFLTCVVGMGKNDNEYWKPRENQFRRDIQDVFGKRILELVWTHDTIVNSRIARNCLSHASGKVTDELRNRKHNFEILEGHIHITPRDLREQMDVMKLAIEELGQESIQISR